MVKFYSKIFAHHREHNAGEDGRTRKSARVDGPQTNSRAELSAILATLITAEGRSNQLIITDSESSIDLLDTWRQIKLSNRQKKKNTEPRSGQMHSRGRKESQRDNKVLPHLQSPTERYRGTSDQDQTTKRKDE